MKKINLTILLIVLLLCITHVPVSGAGFYSGGHDSLLFDGAGDNSNIAYDDKKCKLKVTKVIKKVTGTVYEETEEVHCGKTMKINTMDTRELKEGDYILADKTVTTGKDSYVELEFEDGRKIFLGKDGELSVNKDYCWEESLGTTVNLKKGILSVDDKSMKSKSSMSIRTGKSTVMVGGTVFNVIMNEAAGTHTVQVFEGWVKFNRNMQDEANIKDSQDKGQEMKKLTDDFQAGKITMQEYMQKMLELEKGISNSAPQNDVTVEAGFESVIADTQPPTTPSPLGSDAKTLWDDPEVK